MGINEAVAKFIGGEAQRAYTQWHTVFAAVLTPYSNRTSNGPAQGWAEQIEAIEAQGWILQHWAIAGSNDGKGQQAYPLFRRR